MENKKPVLFVGRFQPFHKGHKNVLERITDNSDVVVVIGSSKKSGTFENPLSFSERKQLIKNHFPEIPLVGAKDMESNKKWVEQVESKTDFRKVVTGNPRTKRVFENQGYFVEKQEMYNREKFRGTLIRKKAIESDDSWKKLVPEKSLGLLKKFGFEKRLCETRDTS